MVEFLKTEIDAQYRIFTDKVVLYASSVAAAVGKNPYKSPQVQVVETWGRTFPEDAKRKSTITSTHHVAFASLKAMDPAERDKFVLDMSKTIDKSPPGDKTKNFTPFEAMEVLKSVKSVAQNATSQEDLNLRASKVMRVCKDNVSNASTQAVLAENIRGCIATSRGTKTEDSDLNMYEQKRKTRVGNRNAKYFRKCVGTWGLTEIVISGKVDGIEESVNSHGVSEGRIVETKRRRNRFLGVPSYEQVQMLTYMWLTDLRKCIHVENYGTESRETEVEWDQAQWEEICQGIRTFCGHLGAHCNDPNRWQVSSEIMMNAAKGKK